MTQTSKSRQPPRPHPFRKNRSFQANASKSSSTVTSKSVPASASKHIRKLKAPKPPPLERKQSARRGSVNEVILPSVEGSEEKRTLESGIEYSARRRLLGAGKPVTGAAVNVVNMKQASLDNRSDSLPVHGLNTDLGKEEDDDWLPLENGGKLSQPRPATQTSPDNWPPVRVHQAPGFQNQCSPDVVRKNAVKLETRTNSVGSSPNWPLYQLRSVSPPVWNPTLRKRKLEEDGFVEMPRAVVVHEQTKKLLKVQRVYLRAQKRQEKGKDPERASMRKGREPPAEGLVTPSIGRQATRKGLKFEMQGHQTKFSIAGGIDSQPTVQNQSASTKVEVDLHANGAANAVHLGNLRSNASSQEDGLNTDISSMNQWRITSTEDGCGSHIHPDRASGRYQRESERCRTLSRAYSDLNPRPENCTCQMLPKFFTNSRRLAPKMSAWAGGKLEFLEHAKQISSCPGHPERVRRYCQDALKKENYPERLGLHAAVDFAVGARKCNQSSTKRPAPSTYPQDQPLPLDWDLSMRSSSKITGLPHRVREGSMLGNHQTSEDGSLQISLSQSPPSQISTTRNRGSASKSQWAVMNMDRIPIPLKSMKPRATVVKAQAWHDSARHEDEDNVKDAPTTARLKAPTGVDSMSPATIALRKRHQSMPAFSKRPRADGADTAAQSILDERSQQDIDSRSIPGHIVVPTTEFIKLAQDVKRIASTLMQPKTSSGHNVPENVAASTSAAETQPDLSQPFKIKRKTAAQRKAAGQPELDRNVPMHLRLPDDGLVEVGIIKSRYERHKKAPYAFSWHGRIYAEYDYLLIRLGEYGKSIGDDKIISRLKP